MSTANAVPADYEPGVATVDLVCDRLGELGLAIGPGMARQLVRAVLELELPRLDARLRDALETSLQTIRVAAQSAMGLLGTTMPTTAPLPAPPVRAPGRKTPLPEALTSRRLPRRPTEAPRDESRSEVEEERRPVFKRRRGH